jgi:hypothetical protein
MSASTAGHAYRGTLWMGAKKERVGLEIAEHEVPRLQRRGPTRQEDIHHASCACRKVPLFSAKLLMHRLLRVADPRGKPCGAMLSIRRSRADLEPFRQFCR